MSGARLHLVSGGRAHPGASTLAATWMPKQRPLRLNLEADDGRSFVELHEAGETGGPFVPPEHTRTHGMWTQVSSKISVQRAVGEMLHSHGKIQTWNPYVCECL